MLIVVYEKTEAKRKLQNEMCTSEKKQVILKLLGMKA